jgi:hypothetical protein
MSNSSAVARPENGIAIILNKEWAEIVVADNLASERGLVYSLGAKKNAHFGINGLFLSLLPAPEDDHIEFDQRIQFS